MSSQIPDVRPGQVWADNDKRSRGRTVRVDRIVASERGDRVAVCTVLTNPDFFHRDARGRSVSIKVRRFRPISTGYRLIEDAPASEAGDQR